MNMKLLRAPAARAAGPTYRPLQDGLRSAGRWLDDQERRLACLCLTRDGVTIGVRANSARAGIIMCRLDHAGLAQIGSQESARRGAGGAWFGSRDGLFPTGYEDALRLLGAVAADQEWAGLCLAVVDRYLLVTPLSGAVLAPLVLDQVAWHCLLNEIAIEKRVSMSSLRVAAGAAGSSFTTRVPSHTARRGEQDAQHYARMLAGLALLLAERKAEPLLIAETVEGGLFVVGQAPSTAPCVAAIGPDELEHLAARAARKRVDAGRLRLLGDYFDTQGAAAIAACSLEADDWAVECAMLSETREGASGLERITIRVHFAPEPAPRRWPWSRR